MNARHLASDETLTDFASGRLDEGLSLVVAAHVEMNAASARSLRAIQAVGGGLLDQAEPVPMLGSVRDVLERLPEQEAAQPQAGSAAEMPRVLAPYALGPWRPIGRGIGMRRVDVPGAQARVFMLRASPGTWLPDHKHTGLEWTTILDGAYQHAYGRYTAGDFDEADETHEHLPHVDPVAGCTCLVALTGEVRFKGWLGRLLQPLVRL